MRARHRILGVVGARDLVDTGTARMSVADYVAPGRCTCCGNARTTWSPQAIVDALKAFHAPHGRAPKSKEWLAAAPDHPAGQTVAEKFGSWSRGIEAAGLAGAKRGRSPYWTRERIVEAMLDHGLREGHWPTRTEWSHAAPEHPSNWTVYNAFGSWDAAVAFAAGRTDPGLVKAAAVAAVEPRCSECGTELENCVLGCKTCHDRQAKREMRAQFSSARRLAAVESPLTTATPVAEAFAASTSDREPDVAAVRRREAA